MTRTIRGGLVCGLLACACVGTSKYTGQQESVGWEDDLRERAAFELKCQPKALTVQSLGGGMGGRGESAGVTGCGKQAVYKFMGPQFGWIADSVHAE